MQNSCCVWGNRLRGDGAKAESEVKGRSYSSVLKSGVKYSLNDTVMLHPEGSCSVNEMAYRADESLPYVGRLEALWEKEDGLMYSRYDFSKKLHQPSDSGQHRLVPATP